MKLKDCVTLDSGGVSPVALEPWKLAGPGDLNALVKAQARSLERN